MSTQLDDAWHGLEQTAAVLGVSVRTVQNMAQRGDIFRRQVGRRSEYRAPIAPVASVAPFEELQRRLEELEFAVEEQATEFEQRIDDLVNDLDSEQSERESLAEALQEVQEELIELKNRVDDLEASSP